MDAVIANEDLRQKHDAAIKVDNQKKVKAAQELETTRSRLEKAFAKERLTIKYDDVKILCHVLPNVKVQQCMTLIFQFAQLSEGKMSPTPEFMNGMLSEIAEILAIATVDETLDKEFWESTGTLASSMELVKQIITENNTYTQGAQEEINKFRKK